MIPHGSYLALLSMDFQGQGLHLVLQGTMPYPSAPVHVHRTQKRGDEAVLGHLPQLLSHMTLESNGRGQFPCSCLVASSSGLLPADGCGVLRSSPRQCTRVAVLDLAKQAEQLGTVIPIHQLGKLRHRERESPVLCHVAPPCLCHYLVPYIPSPSQEPDSLGHDLQTKSHLCLMKEDRPTAGNDHQSCVNALVRVLIRMQTTVASLLS